MKYIAALIFVVFAVEIAVGVEYCGELPGCGEGECCKGSFYHRVCIRLSKEGEPCERPNSGENYSVACPCEDGMICSVINRCQRLDK
ncbi:U9-ctenitoxin-Pr1a-like isoform X1 [Parasteatoda tepidariorum]|uniref:U9-ctenitoxin-Pr1a-like isoform X1 n=1 Tax=Parasteatoda tepidariorum TaxID=114398 RepID=UPI00077F8DB5|nr:U9-ctenitoxin-Pr1a-like isoform X1 [Parasteatoda tepidariorum]